MKIKSVSVENEIALEGSETHEKASESGKKKLMVYCKRCQENHLVSIDKGIVTTSSSFPVKYSYIHGDPKFVLLLYIDRNFIVRGTEIADLHLERDDINDILSDKSNAMRSLDADLVNGLYFVYEGKVAKEYVNPNIGTNFQLKNLRKIWKIRKNLATDGEDLNEFFLKFSDQWIAGMRFDTYELYLAISESVDCDRLCTQMMFIFERLASSV